MKKLILLSCAALALFFVTSCSKKASNKFVVGLDDSFPPLGFRDENNEIVGYDIDLAKEAISRLGYEAVFQPIDWAAKEQELNSKQIDCIWNGFTITDERKASMSFTKAYLANAQVVVVRADSGFAALSDLAGKTIGVQAGSSAQKAIDSSADFKASLKGIVEFKENVTALNDLEIGNIDGVVMDLVVANYCIKQGNRPVVVMAESLSPEEYGVAFRKSEPEVRDKFQATLEAMEADGTVAKISEKWFGTNLSVIGK